MARWPVHDGQRAGLPKAVISGMTRGRMELLTGRCPGPTQTAWGPARDPSSPAQGL